MAADATTRLKFPMNHRAATSLYGIHMHMRTYYSLLENASEAQATGTVMLSSNITKLEQ